MTGIQNFFTKLLPAKWAESMRKESMMWKVHCRECGWTRSIWELGGIRWKAASHHKKIRVFCPECKSRRWAEVEKEVPSPELQDSSLR